jgi:hypothetical protein
MKLERIINIFIPRKIEFYPNEGNIFDDHCNIRAFGLSSCGRPLKRNNFGPLQLL